MARGHHVPISTLRGRPCEWTPVDRALAIALQLHDESVCSSCGQYADEAYDERSEGWYETRQVVCQGCGAIERHRRTAADDKERDGAKTYVIDVRRQGDHEGG